MDWPPAWEWPLPASGSLLRTTSRDTSSSTSIRTPCAVMAACRRVSHPRPPPLQAISSLTTSSGCTTTTRSPSRVTPTGPLPRTWPLASSRTDGTPFVSRMPTISIVSVTRSRRPRTRRTARRSSSSILTSLGDLLTSRTPTARTAPPLARRRSRRRRSSTGFLRTRPSTCPMACTITSAIRCRRTVPRGPRSGRSCSRSTGASSLILRSR
mmetsp:Transcript_9088/g.16400  ORF Transcript_9088/g.16400 Transcript_9088/m.16400 type:complete len:211 (+) Transcript_9088:497-1129(+)